MKADFIALCLFSFLSGMYFSSKFSFLSVDFFVSLGILFIMFVLGSSIGKGEEIRK